MSDLKSMRLPKAATTYNVGMDHIVEELRKNGFTIENNPNSKLTPDMVEALEKAFNKDKVLKNQAIGTPVEKTKKETIILKEEIPIVAKKKEDEKELLIKKNTISVQKEEKEEKKEPEQPVQPEVEKEPEVEKVETSSFHKLEGPKIVGKLDLDKPKKTTKKKEEQPTAEVIDPKPKTKKEEKVEEVVVKPEKIEEKPVAEVTEIFHKTVYEKLEGPKILGKIEIKPDKPETKKPADGLSEGEKRKRKRIEKPKREKVTPAPQTDNRPNRFQKDNQNRFQKGKPSSPEMVTEISEKEIEEKIRATMAKIQAQTSKSDRSKIRKEKRDAIQEKIANELAQKQDSKLKVTEFMTVSELANMMNVPAVKVIQTCMQLGMMVSINQRLDAEIIELVAGENGYDVEFQSIEDQTAFSEDEPDLPQDLETRAPIVTIMGHVDHGKTSLLDYIRNANVVSKEAGGITQHIGAYDVIMSDGRKITFLDTPGHEAFTAMRARGAKVTDLAVIVIAADDAVMPQTKEAINHAQAAGVPMIFAFNKIDKDGANADKIREQLSVMNLLVEEWGGPYQSQEISAKKGLNIDLLMEKILLQAELLELKANPKKLAVGTIIEASMDKGRGFTATVLVQAGTLNKSDIMVSGPFFGRIKAMLDHTGKRIEEAGPSTPVQILGLNGAPQAGELFKVFDNEADAKELANKRAQLIRETGIRTKKHITLDEIGRRLALGSFKELNLIIKGDVDGSVEALADSLEKLATDQIAVHVVHKGVGQISESDVNLATAADAIIIGFNVRPSLNAKRIAESENIEIKLYSVIYNAIEDVKNAMEGLLEPTIEEKIIGNVEVREVYHITKVGTIAGCFVKEGRILRSSKVRIIRDGIVVHTGTLSSLKRFKDDAKEVTSGMDCGVQLKDYQDIKANDNIEVFEEIEIAGKL